MSTNFQMNDKEINTVIIVNVLKLLERRKLIKSWEQEEKKLNIESNSNLIEIELLDKTKCGIHIVTTKLSSIVAGTPLDQYLSSNINVRKIIIFRSVLKKVIKQIIHDYKNAEFFFETEMLEDLPSKDFIPIHEIINDDEKKELLSKYSEKELSKILNTDVMCRYYGGKIGDIFKITRPSFTAGYSIFYRKVAFGSLEVLF